MGSKRCVVAQCKGQEQQSWQILQLAMSAQSQSNEKKHQELKRLHVHLQKTVYLSFGLA